MFKYEAVCEKNGDGMAIDFVNRHNVLFIKWFLICHPCVLSARGIEETFRIF